MIKPNPTLSIAYLLITFASLIVSAFLLSEAVDLTIKHGLVVHEEYVYWAIGASLITATLLYLKRYFVLDDYKERG